MKRLLYCARQGFALFDRLRLCQIELPRRPSLSGMVLLVQPNLAVSRWGQKVHNLAARSIYSLFALAGGLHAVSEEPNGVGAEWQGIYAPLPVKTLSSTGSFGMAFDASLLVWQAHEGGLEFAAKNNPLHLSSSSILIDVNADLLGLDFAWEPAYKINALFQFYRLGWDIDLRWTSFYTRSSHQANASLSSNGSGLFPLWLLPSGNGSADPLFGSARGTWQMHLNTVDWELGHAYWLSEAISLRIAGGLKALLIEQIFRVHYAEGLSSASPQVVSGAVTMKNDSWGLGPRMGLFSHWMVGKGISIRAASAGFLALSQMHVKRQDEDVSLTLPSTFNFVRSKFNQSFWVYRPGLECLIGVGFETEWKGALFGLEAAYEMQYFWEQNMLNRLVNSSLLYANYSSRGDLTLQGLTWTMRCGF